MNNQTKTVVLKEINRLQDLIKSNKNPSENKKYQERIEYLGTKVSISDVAEKIFANER